MARKRSSQSVSRIASQFLKMSLRDFIIITADAGGCEEILTAVHKLAASVLSQDEVKGK